MTHQVRESQRPAIDLYDERETLSVWHPLVAAYPVAACITAVMRGQYRHALPEVPRHHALRQRCPSRCH